MTSRFPEPASSAEAEGIPDPGFGETEALISGDTEGRIEPPHDTAEAVDDFGTTGRELHDGEPLDGRLSREEPDMISQAGTAADESANPDTPFDERAGQGVGRLVESDEGAREDTEAEMTATDAGTDLGGYTAEESAMHMEPEA